MTHAGEGGIRNGAPKASRRSTGPRPGGPDGERASFPGPVPYPPLPLLCHAHSPPRLAPNRHTAVILWAVPPPRHRRGHGPSLPWLPTTGANLFM